MLRKVTNDPMTTRAHLQSELASQGVQVIKKTIVRELIRTVIRSYTPRKTPLLTVKLNSIENLWRLFKFGVHKQCPKNHTELKVICMEEWEKIP